MSRHASSWRAAAHGFTLVELLVALAIAAALIATAVSALSGALAAQARAEGTTEAVTIARSRLALLELDPREGEEAGEEHIGGRVYRWQVVTVPHALPVAEDEPVAESTLPLLHASVRVEWNEGKSERSVSAGTLLHAATGHLR